MLGLVDARGRPLYKITSGGNIVRTQKVPRYRKLKVLIRDGYSCVLCMASGPDVELEVDHIVRYADGGGNHESNLRTLCKPCHSARARQGD
jgi:5-methylcytosine-specific restriction endonuclease McrA